MLPNIATIVSKICTSRRTGTSESGAVLITRFDPDDPPKLDCEPSVDVRKLIAIRPPTFEAAFLNADLTAATALSESLSTQARAVYVTNQNRLLVERRIAVNTIILPTYLLRNHATAPSDAVSSFRKVRTVADVPRDSTRVVRAQCGGRERRVVPVAEQRSVPPGRGVSAWVWLVRRTEWTKL
ncbi:hypothetical protein C8R43DRAFT_1235310 [Mycena crocata]|nr:hypothetical protein C8R43DRAFT_1235310 [Mycena crocata]